VASRSAAVICGVSALFSLLTEFNKLLSLLCSKNLQRRQSECVRESSQACSLRVEIVALFLFFDVIIYSSVSVCRHRVYEKRKFHRTITVLWTVTVKSGRRVPTFQRNPFPASSE
jgi:uncharacterized Tic20 family protein